MRRRELRTYIVLLVASIALLWLWWIAVLSDQEIRSEWIVESGGEMTFLAEDERTVITGVGLSWDGSNEEETELTFSGTIHIVSSGGYAVWGQLLTGATIPSYLAEMEGLMEEVLELEEGETYTLYIWDEELHEVDDITWVFYGETVEGPVLIYVITCICALLLLSLLYWHYYGTLPIPARTLWVILLAGCSVMMIFLLLGDTGDYREAYALSNTILCDWFGREEISTLIPSGVLRMADSANAQTLVHFWKDWSYGNISIERAAVFTETATGMDIRSLLPALGITWMRMIGAPYQWYFIVPGLLNTLFYAALLWLAFILSPEMRPFSAMLSLLPSALAMISSCSRVAWNLGFGILLVCFCVRMIHSEYLRYEDLIGAAVTALAATAGQPAYLTLVLLIPAVRQRRTDRLERGLLQGVTLAVVLCSLVMIVLSSGGLSEIWPFSQSVMIEGRDEPISTIEWVVGHLWWSLMIFINTFLMEGGTLVLSLFLGEGLAQTLPAWIPLVLIASIIIAAAMLQQGKGTGRDVIPVRDKPEERNPAVYVPVLGILMIMLLTLCNNASAVDLWMGQMVIPDLKGQDFLPLLLALPFLLRHWRRADRKVRDLQYLLAALAIGCIPLSLGGILMVA